jgi:protein-S-isoprenylcysteine O-methyltransferase Ste14
MDAVWLGALAVLIMFGFDLANLARWVTLKRAAPFIAGGFFFAAIYVILRQSPAIFMPRWAIAVGIALSLSGIILLGYSLAIDIPFQSTYLAPDASSRLITTGTYALTRHPGVLWLTVFLIGLLIANRSLALFVAIPVWLGLDALHVWLQDRYFFPRQFPDYGAYQQQTPMLIPNRSSIDRCVHTLPRCYRRSS